jgi:hypothetical protein|tara:strand:- start:405 stop:716 length:312 start_codon:yes stop_codon:yes gene_type:complete
MVFDSRTTDERNKGQAVVQRYVTAGGKEIQIVRDASTILLNIQFGSGGELPREFRGKFTNLPSAVFVVEQYLDKHGRWEDSTEEVEDPITTTPDLDFTSDKVA